MSTDTEVTLLLCGVNRDADGLEHSPLTAGEYARVTNWLRDVGLRAADLTTPEVLARISIAGLPNLRQERLKLLLDRQSLFERLLAEWQSLGLWMLSPWDEKYPCRMMQRLQQATPPLLFGIGNQSLLADGGLAIVGSRDADADALEFACLVAGKCANEHIQVVSGGARGIDREAMSAVLDTGGKALGVLAEGLAREASSGRNELMLQQQRLTLVSPYLPAAGFSIGNAMGRNKCIYAMADWALVISSAANEGGTWAGAVENLRHRWTPLFARDGDDIPEGNRRLMAMGAHPFPEMLASLPGNLRDIFESVQHSEDNDGASQTELFG